MSRPPWLATKLATRIAHLVLVAPFVLSAPLAGCHGRGATTPGSDDDQPATPAVQAKATGAVATLSVVVHGTAPDRYKRAFERALLRSDLKVADAASTAFDLELVLEVTSDVQEEIDADADPDDPNTVGHEMAKYLARVTVRTPDGSTIDKVEANPDFELRLLSGMGGAIKTIRSKEQADVEFSGEGMNQLASKIVTSEAVSKFAAARPVTPAK
jgi:hypothetical protein